MFAMFERTRIEWYDGYDRDGGAGAAGDGNAVGNAGDADYGGGSACGGGNGGGGAHSYDSVCFEVCERS